MFKIIKKGSNNFWHVYNNGAKNVSISDFEVVLDDVLNTFVIVLRNGANIPQIALSVLDIIVIDETASSVEETFLTASQLRARLVVLGYTAYLGAGNADSITGLISEGTNVTITGTGTLADPYVISSSGGSGTTPTLQEVLIEGNEFISADGLNKVVFDEGGLYYYVRPTTGDAWVKVSEFGQAGLGFNLNDEFGTGIKGEFNPFVGFKIYDGTNEIIITPTSATKNGVELATIDDIPTTATDLDALKRDGSNANSDVDLGVYGLIAKRIKSVDATYPDGLIDIDPNIKTATIGDVEDALNGTKLTINDATEEIDFTITNPDNFRVNGQKIITQDNLNTFKTAEFLDATSSIQAQLNSKQPLLSFTPYKFVQTSQTAHTGTTSETIVATSTINGGTFNSSDVMKAIFKCTKGVTTSTVTIRLKINTTNSLSGATQIAILSVTTALQFAKLKRDYDLFGGTLYGFNFTSSVASDDITSGTIGQSTAYNTANTLYFFWTVQLGTSGDSVIPNLANLTN